MDFFSGIVDLFNSAAGFILNLESHLSEVAGQYGAWIYLILFAIIFAETGLVVAPVLPGDGLLFALGIIAHNPETGLNVWSIIVLLTVAGILGNTANYHIARVVGDKLLERQKSDKLKSNLDRTHALFNRYGGWALVVARFIPFARTFAPFAAGISSMSYGLFQMYNVVGAVLWVGSCVGIGYFIGRSSNTGSLLLSIMVGVVLISVLPIFIKYLSYRYKTRKQKDSLLETASSSDDCSLS